MAVLANIAMVHKLIRVDNSAIIPSNHYSYLIIMVFYYLVIITFKVFMTCFDLGWPFCPGNYINCLLLVVLTQLLMVDFLIRFISHDYFGCGCCGDLDDLSCYGG